MPVTNRGKFRILQVFFRNQSVPATFYLALAKATVTPTVDTNTLNELAEVAAGNGYTAGGVAVARSAAAWDVLTEDDATDRALVQMADVAFTASGGTLPSDAVGATYVLLLDDNATPASRDVIAFAALNPAPLLATTGQTLTIQDWQFDGI
jgi:hypothetical protein